MAFGTYKCVLEIENSLSLATQSTVTAEKSEKKKKQQNPTKAPSNKEPLQRR